MGRQYQKFLLRLFVAFMVLLPFPPNSTQSQAFFNSLMMKRRASTCDTANPGLVQKSVMTLDGYSAITGRFYSPQTAGNLNVVVISWYGNTGTVSSIGDTAGNSYSLAVGPTRGSFSTQYIYYAKNIVASSTNAVTVNLSSSPSGISIYVHEYQGLDTSSPLNVTAVGTGSTTSITSANLTTTQACALLFAAGYEGGTFTTNGTNYKSAMNFNGNYTQHRVVSSTGTYNSTGTQDSALDYIVQLVAFKKNLGAIAQNTIRNIQSNGFYWAGTTSINTAFTSAQTAGNLIVVRVGWDDHTGTVSSISDTKGNTYTLASGPIRYGSSATQYIYYAKNIAAATAGQNVVTVSLSGSKNVTLSVLEYAGLDPVTPLDQISSNGNFSGSPTAPNVTTTYPNELLLGFILTKNGGATTDTVATNYKLVRIEGWVNSTSIIERVVSSTGTYGASTTISPDTDHVIHLVTFH
ncbi:MAG: hypothetical protein ACAH59_06170 [Pseudobdellovibrionaceae bacterium]